MNTSRRRLGLYLPITFLAVIAIGWSVFWYVAAGRLEAAADNWIAREAQAGRIYDCTNRTVGGFPFRLEIACTNPRAELPGDGGPVRLGAARFLAMAHVYRPTYVYGELQGPLNISMNGGGPELVANWSAAQASLSGGIERLDRVSLVVDDLRMVTALNEEPVLASSKLEAHARPAPEGGAGAYDLMASLNEAAIPFLDTLVGDTDTATLRLNMSVHGLDDLRPRQLSERLRAFVQAGGNLRINQARIERGGAVIHSEGDIRLDREGRPEGQLSLMIQGGDELLRRAPALQRLGPVAAMGISLLGQRGSLDGKPAIGLQVNMAGGTLSLGGIRLAQVPPLF